MSGCKYMPEGRGFGVRFTLPSGDDWTEEAIQELTDWLTDEFGDPNTERWYRMMWTVYIPDPTIATLFRLRWC